VPEVKTKMISMTLRTEKRDAEPYEREVFHRVEDIVRPYLTTPITWKHYVVETTLCEHFIQTPCGTK
jgi:hypothetical protein